MKNFGGYDRLGRSSVKYLMLSKLGHDNKVIYPARRSAKGKAADRWGLSRKDGNRHRS